MKKAAILVSPVLITLACAAPTGSDSDGGEMVIGGDGDVNQGTGGMMVVPGTGGANAPGSGGAPGVGGTPAPGAGGTPAPGAGGTPAGPVMCAGTGWSVNNGYADNGTLCGFAWTGTFGTGSTIDPPCAGGECFMGATICATGTIPAEDVASDSFPGVMIGWNVSQDPTGAAEGTWTSTGAGITPNFTAMGATGDVRIVIQSGGTDYCALAKNGEMMPWSSFTIGCWEAGGTAFTAGSPITAILLQANSAPMAQTITSLCLDSLTVN